MNVRLDFRLAGAIMAALLASFTVSACGSASRPALRASPVIIGVNSDITWGIPSADVRKEVSLIEGAHTRWVRVSVALNAAEYWGPGQLNMPYLSQLDAAVRLARRSGLHILMDLDRAPYWASADPHKHLRAGKFDWNPYWQYRQPRDYARIAVDLVRRYEGLGVEAYELWNEPNYPTFWPSGVSAAAYTRLLKVAYPAIKAADPKATVLMGGLSDLGSYRYLRGLYAAGAKGFYDAADFHIYPPRDPADCPAVDGRPKERTFCVLQGLREEMLANDDRAPAWVTELGWSTCRYSWCVRPSQQAGYLRSAIALLNQKRYSWVRAVFIYSMRDEGAAAPSTPWGGRLGLVERSFVPKPAYAALEAATGDAAHRSTQDPIRSRADR